MTSKLKIPKIPEEERTPLVVALLEIIRIQREQLDELRDEIARLKGQKPKPKIRPSALDKELPDAEKTGSGAPRPGSSKREKTRNLQIHETVVIPAGRTFKGYEDFTVQGLLLLAHNKLYRRERWQTPSGGSIVAPLPDEVKALGHFDASLLSFILMNQLRLAA